MGKDGHGWRAYTIPEIQMGKSRCICSSEKSVYALNRREAILKMEVNKYKKQDLSSSCR